MTRSEKEREKKKACTLVPCANVNLFARNKLFKNIHNPMEPKR